MLALLHLLPYLLPSPLSRSPPQERHFMRPGPAVSTYAMTERERDVGPHQLLQLEDERKDEDEEHSGRFGHCVPGAETPTNTRLQTPPPQRASRPQRAKAGSQWDLCSYASFQEKPSRGLIVTGGGVVGLTLSSPSSVLYLAVGRDQVRKIRETWTET